jgi:hypothetical protein
VYMINQMSISVHRRKKMPRTKACRSWKVTTMDQLSIKTPNPKCWILLKIDQ